MAIDFGLLTPQATPHQGVIGTIAPQPAGPNPIDSLASGLLEGAKAGTSIMASRQGIAESQQRMDQNAQLFPSQLQQAETKAQSDTLDLQTKQSQVKSAKEVSDAFHKNWDEGMNQMAKSDPAGYVKLQGDIAKTKESLQTTATAATENKKAALSMYDDFATKGYGLVQAAAAAEKQQPGSGQAVYQQGLKMMGPTLAAQLPQKFDANTFHTLTYVGAESHLAIMKDQETKNATNESKNAGIIGDLQDKVNKGKATDAEKAKLESMQSQLATKNKKTQGDSLVDKGEQQTTIASLKAIDKTADTAQASSTTIDMMSAIDKEAGTGSFANTSVTGKKFLSAASGALGIPYDPNTGVEEGFKHLSTLGRFDVLQNLRGRPNLVEFQQSLDSVPQITNSPEGRKLMISMAQFKNNSASAYRDFSHEWAKNHNYSLVGRDDAWNNFQAAIGSGYNPKSKTFDSSKLKDGTMEKFVNDPQLQKAGAISPITHKPLGQFDNKEEFNKWYSAQSEEAQKDIQANPSKYGIK